MKKTIKWTMPTENMIKFEEDKKPYEYTSAVAKFMTSNGFKDGDAVDVEIDDEQGDNGTVVKISKSSETSSEKVEKEEVKNDYDKKEEVNSSVSSDKKELTIKGISFKNKGIIFAEEENWYTYNEELEEAIKAVGKGGKLSFVYEPKDKGNDLITQVLVVEKNQEVKSEVKNDYDKPKETKMTNTDAFYRIKELERQIRYLENNKQESIEIQCCLNCANQTVSRLFAGKVDANNKDDGSLIKTLIASLTEHNYTVLNNLKTKCED